MNTSRTISGFLCLAAICLPLLIAPFQIEQSLRFVTVMENRTPHKFPAPSGRSYLMDAKWWAEVSSAFEDRMPFRGKAFGLQRKLHLVEANSQIFSRVAQGHDHWLFYRRSLSVDLGSFEDAQLAISTADIFLQTPHPTKLFILVAPDKASIYPEQLAEPWLAEYRQSLPQRNLVQSWFALADVYNKIDIWTPLRDLKLKSTKPIYEPGGSHFNSLGAMVMAESMVKTVAPSFWNDDDIALAWSENRTPDLARIGGYIDQTELMTRLHVQREGVRRVRLFINDVEVDSDAEIPEDRNSDKLSIKSVSASAASPLIPGRTLVIHDSAIGIYLRPTLMEFYQDIQFIHFDNITPQAFQESLQDYDQVYFESVERHFVSRVIQYFGPTTQNNTQSSHAP